MSLKDFYTVGDVYWCRTHDGVWVLGKAEAIDDAAMTIKIRTPDQAACWWPFKLVKHGALWVAGEFMDDFEPSRAVQEVLDQWNISTDCKRGRLLAWREAAQGCTQC